MVGWRGARPARRGSGPSPSPPRSRCLSRGARSSASLLAFPGGTCTNLELFRGSESPTSPSPRRPRPAPGRPLARCLGAAGHRLPLSRSQFGRAERRASRGCGRREPGATPGAGAPGARAARGQEGGSWRLGGRAERRCPQGGRLPMDVCRGRRIKEQKERGGGGSHSCTKPPPPPPLPPRRSRRLLRRK